MPRIIPEENISGGSGSGDAVQTTFVYRPGGSASGNVYNSWPNLYNDLVTIEGPKLIQIDDSIISPATIPSGFYNLDDAIIIGDSTVKDNLPTLQLSDGAVFTDLQEVHFIELIGDSLAASLIASSSKQIILRDSLLSVNSGKSEIFQSSSTFDVVLDNTIIGGSNPVFDITGGTTTFYLENQSQILSNLIYSSGSSAVDFNIVDPNITLLSQPNISGSTSTINLSEADKIFYDNTASGLTADNVQDAIDEISVSTGGDVIGPGPTVTDKGIVTFDGAGGLTIQDSGVRHYGKLSSAPTSPVPSEGDVYYDTNLEQEMFYSGSRSKWLSTESMIFQFGRNKSIAPGQYYFGIDGRILSNNLGFYAIYSGTVVEIGYTRKNSDSTTFEVVSNGSTIDSLASSSTTGGSASLDGDFSSGDILAIRNSSGGNTVSDVQGWIKIKWRTS